MKTLDLKHTYEYKGQKVFLADVDDMPNVRPLEMNDYGIGCYPIEEFEKCLGDPRVTYDESYGFLTDEINPICCAYCQSVEDRQVLTCEWLNIDFAVSSLIEYKLCIKTDNYYNWTSVLTDFVNKIEVAAEDGRITLEQKQEFEEEWDEIVDDVLDEVKEKFGKGERAWNPEIPTFDEVLDEYTNVYLLGLDYDEEHADDDDE